MSHGIDVCRCGAVVQQCRCIGPHTARVVCETCGACRSKPAQQTTAPTPTTASLHREMVEALRGVDGDLPTRLLVAADQWDKQYGAESEFGKRLREEAAKARAALDGWEKRAPLRDDPKLWEEVEYEVCRAMANPDGDHVIRVNAILDALEALLFGERG